MFDFYYFLFDYLEDSKKTAGVNEEDEDYDKWRERMIQEAQEEIKQQAKRVKLC
jgi:hypothetical protein